MEDNELRHVWMPIGKTEKGYSGIITDTSIDRDDEFMSKELILKWGSKDFYIPILLDHQNKVENNIGFWTDKQVVEKNGHSALKVTPQFFESNPKSKMVQGMLDEGAMLGLSIGAIPKSFEEVKIGDRMHRKWTDAELVEASFVPVASNRQAFASIAKSFDFVNKDSEVNKMEIEPIVSTIVEDIVDKAVSKEPEAVVSKEVVVDNTKDLIADLQKQLLDLKAQTSEVSQKFESRTTQLKGLVEEMTTKSEAEKIVEPTLAGLIKAKYRV